MKCCMRLEVSLFNDTCLGLPVAAADKENKETRGELQTLLVRKERIVVSCVITLLCYLNMCSLMCERNPTEE